MVMKRVTAFCRRYFGLSTLLLSWGGVAFHLQANPTGGTVTQGAATISGSGTSQVTINQTSPNAFINWASFNVAPGETTSFNQPSSSSVTWNYIDGPGPSGIDGNINALGYVILQNPDGFSVGGQAVITAHGLVMTTASTPALNLSSGGPWAFNTPPPTAKIINYGLINITGGGPAFLIASDVENRGTISAPGGKIGLYAGQTVLVSTSPDGRGLSAQVTLPQGSVDNEGKLIADGGSIMAHAQFVNQNGLVQANSARNVNGTIELVAGAAVTLGADSTLSARGAASGMSSGGTVTIKSGNTFSDAAGSTINISGGAQGGNGGQVELSAPSMTAINTRVNGEAMPGSVGGVLFLDPDYIVLDQTAGGSLNVNGSSGSSLVGDNPGSTLYLDVGTFGSSYADSAFMGLSQITLQAKYDISMGDGTVWNLSSSTGQSVGQLNLQAGRNIIFGNGARISDANNWSVSLQAGYDFVNNMVQNGAGSIYLGGFNGSNPLNNSGSIQMAKGSVSLSAGQDILVGSGSVNTTGGGNIDVTALSGNVNSGTGTSGFNYLTAAPWYAPASSLGGISTAAGGNVSITAGIDVISFPTTTVAPGDPGTGAFGPQAGNVTINAGGSVYGNYVVMNGTGTIVAGKNIGDVPSSQNPVFDNVALSLAKGSWNLNAQGNIYLQEVRNPNGIFNNRRFISGKVTGGTHLFDYDSQASVALTAGNGVYLTGNELPRPNDPVPMLLPPIVIINAGSGGVNLQTPTAYSASPQNQNNLVTLSDYDITLFPSPYGNLAITATGGGGFSSDNADGSPTTLLMSDSGLTHWSISSSDTQPFGETDHASGTPGEMNNANPVLLNISGTIENVTLQVSKFAQINVGGDMIGFTFLGENLQANQATTITVGGQIFNPGSFNSVTLDETFPGLPAADFQPPGALPPGITLGSWYLPLAAAIDPGRLPAGSLIGVSLAQLTTDINNARLFTDISLIGGNLVYDSTTKKLTAIGPIQPDFLAALQTPALTVIRYGPDGRPLLDLNPTLPNGQPNPNYGHLVTDTITWTPAQSVNYADITQLNTDSLGATPVTLNRGGLVVGGAGTFNVTANSISLGNSDGILSVGNGSALGRDYSFLGPYINSGASINVTAGYLETPSSVIAALGGGNVNVTCTGEIPGSPLDNHGVGVSMDLGSQDLEPFIPLVMQNNGGIALGIYTTGGGNVNVTALGDIDINTSRIGTFNGGNVVVESQTGDVNAGTGGSTFFIPIHVFSPGAPPYSEPVFANGIEALTLLDPTAVPGGATAPGDITIVTPQGDINADQGGIKQEALNGTAPSGPAITLTAGTPAVPGDYLNLSGPPLFVGNISLGTIGVIGESVIAQATGTITGLAVSRHNTTITSQSVGNLMVVAGGTANVSAQNSGSGVGITIVGGSGVNANGVGAGATLLGQNVSVNGGAAASTTGTTATATAASQSAAGQASTEAQQQVASNDNGNDDEKKKKKANLTRSVGRVTVVLPKAS
jgi:filamentous hemagglutinin family protein